MTADLRPARVLTSPSAGLLTVALLGGTTARTAVATSGCDGVSPGDQVLVASAGGQISAVPTARNSARRRAISDCPATGRNTCT